MSQIALADAVELIVGIVHIADLIHKPGVAVDVRILKRHGLALLQRQDEILGVEHVEHGPHGVAGHLCHVASGLADSGHGLLHFGGDIGFDELLVAAQLGRMVAADGLVVVGSLVLVEGVAGKVEHTVVERLVLKDVFVGGSLGLRQVARALLHKHVIVEITLVDEPHVEQAKHGDAPHHELCRELAILVEQQEGHSH